mgnify:CR=1 FL=1
MSAPVRFPRFFVTNPAPCPYLPGKTERKVFTELNGAHATELNEANEHAGCIAGPIIDAAGRCIAALSVVVPEQRLARPNREHLIVSVIKAAEKLSRRIGGPRAV